MIIAGVDPGLSGGIAIIQQLLGSTEYHVQPMPVTGEKKRSIQLQPIAELFKLWQIDLVVIEKVHAMPKQGVSSCFTFGKGYGQIQGICAGLFIPFVLVTPQQWKKIVLNGYDWKGDKSMSIKYCQQKYPNINLKATERSRKPHDGICDALCIAEYGRMTQ